MRTARSAQPDHGDLHSAAAASQYERGLSAGAAPSANIEAEQLSRRSRTEVFALAGDECCAASEKRSCIHVTGPIGEGPNRPGRAQGRIGGERVSENPGWEVAGSKHGYRWQYVLGAVLVAP